MRKLAVGGRLISPAGQPCQYYGWEPHKHGRKSRISPPKPPKTSLSPRVRATRPVAPCWRYIYISATVPCGSELVRTHMSRSCKNSSLWPLTRAVHTPRLKPFPVKVALLVFKWRNWENRSSDHTLFTPIEPERLPVGNQLNLEFGRGSMSPF